MMNHEYVATVDKKQLISIDHGNEPQLQPSCDSRKDIDCYKKRKEHDVIDWQLDGLGGEDGLLNSSALKPSLGSDCTPAVKKRDYISDKLFDHKKEPLYGRAEVVKKQMQELADSVAAVINCLEEKVRTIASLASEGLKKIHGGVQLTQEEMKTILEDILEAAY